MRALRSSTYLHANTALHVYKRCQSAALVLRKVDPCFLKIMLQGVSHPQSFWCVPLYTPVITHSSCCKPPDCTVVLVKGPNQVVVQLLIDVQLVYISCTNTSLLPAACPAHACDYASGRTGYSTTITAQASRQRRAEGVTSQLDASLLCSRLPVLAGVHIAAKLCSVVGLANLHAQ